MGIVHHLVSLFTSPGPLRTFLIIALINWAIGIAFVQYFYYRTRRLRNLDEQIKKKSLPFTNSPEKWNRLVHSLFSVFMIPRLIGFFASTIVCTIAVWFLLLGSGSKTSSWRHTWIKAFGKVLARLGLFCSSYIWIYYQDDRLDYTPWLGEGWDKNTPTKRPPIFISNHRTWGDAVFFMTIKEFPSYVASAHVKALPFFGFLAKSFGSFFVQRGDKNSRNTTLDQIKNRVREINENKDIPQLVIFPEGGTSNGLYLLNFKRGAFESEEPVQPYFFEYYSPFCNPASDVIPIHLHLFFMACQPFTTLTVHKMPIMYPTEHMYNKFAGNKDTPRAEIYADVARDIYSKCYGLEKANNSHIEKVALKEYLYESKGAKID